jgi:glycerophosphoryl diester phosphodiesterase
VRDAHAVGLEVHPWTFRPENPFLAPVFRRGDDPQARNRTGLVAQIDAYLDAGIDAFFTDDPASGRQAVDAAAGAHPVRDALVAYPARGGSCPKD